MSLEIQDNFAASYARYSHNADNWQVQPHMIGHVFTDWLDQWLNENSEEQLSKKLNGANRPEKAVREVFHIFMSSLRKRNHVSIPRELQKEVLKEYLED